MRGKVNPMTIVTICAVAVILGIVVSGKIDPVYTLPVFGALVIVLGIAALIKGAKSEKGLRVSDKQKAVICVLLGAFLIVWGVIQILDVQVSQNAIMGVVLVLIITYFIVRITRR